MLIDFSIKGEIFKKNLRLKKIINRKKSQLKNNNKKSPEKKSQK